MKKAIFIPIIAVIVIGLSLLGVKHFLDRDEPVLEAAAAVSATQTAPETTVTEPPTTVEYTGIAGKYDHNKYQKKLEDIAKKYHAVGVSVAVIEGDKIIDTFACGEAIKGELPMTEDTKVRIASISKIFLSTALMLSVEEGKMSLDEDIGTYWGFPMGTHAQGDVITPRSILTHTSSIYCSEDVANMYYDTMAKRLKTGSGIKNIVSGNIKNFLYNNYAMDVLGMTVELVTKKNLDDIISEKIYKNLDIDTAFYCGDMKDKSNVASLYQSDGSMVMSAQRMKTWHRGKPGTKAWGFAGGITITVKELGRLAIMLLNNGVYEGKRCLSEETVRTMEYHEGNFMGRYWQCQPLRYEPTKYGQKDFYYHSGSAYGALSLVGYSRVTGRGVAILTTGARKRAYPKDNIYDEISRLMLNIEAQPVTTTQE